jgi:two-component system, NarL family, capsular synthesis sensor histidine kinase RcsC
VAICGYFRPVASPSHYFTVMTSIAQDPKILLVDDNAVVRDMLVDLVGSLGYAADAASGGAEALALFDRNRYDIVLTDLLMPGMSGWEVLAAVRERNPRMPVVIITGTPAVGDPRASQPGVAVLKKPVDVKALDETIKEKLRQRLAV